MSVVSTPGLEPGVLPLPGSAIVLVSSGLATVNIVVDAPPDVGSPRLKFSLELLSAGTLQPETFVDVSNIAASAAESGFPRLEVVAHVSRLGDVKVPEGDWIAGPDAPAPIEAIGLKSLVSGLSLSAAYMNMQRPGQWVKSASADFIGTRQQASSLLGLKLTIDGAQAANFNLKIDGLFLGSPMMSERGSQVTIVSSSGLDPLIGLRVQLIPRLEKVSSSESTDLGSRVRVFRAQS